MLAVAEQAMHDYVCPIKYVPGFSAEPNSVEEYLFGDSQDTWAPPFGFSFICHYFGMNIGMIRKKLIELKRGKKKIPWVFTNLYDSEVCYERSPKALDSRHRLF